MYSSPPIHKFGAPRPPKVSKNKVPTGARSNRNNENPEKVKSNENINIYSTLEGLGHQNSPEFPCRNQQKTWLQSKCDFGLFKSEKIWKSDPERSPMGDPKSTPNCWKSILVPSECTFAPNDHPNNEKVVSQDPECLKTGPPRPRKINKSVKQNKWNLLEKRYAIPAFLNDFNPANLSNPSSLQINSQPVAEGAGGRGEALEYNLYNYIYMCVFVSIAMLPRLPSSHINTHSDSDAGYHSPRKGPIPARAAGWYGPCNIWNIGEGACGQGWEGFPGGERDQRR